MPKTGRVLPSLAEIAEQVKDEDYEHDIKIYRPDNSAPSLSTVIKLSDAAAEKIAIDGHILKSYQLNEKLLDANSEEACFYGSTSLNKGEIKHVAAGEMEFEFTAAELKDAEYDWQRQSYLVVTEDREHLVKCYLSSSLLTK